MSTSGTTEPTTFSGLSVPQLKALCKEKKISGYSKMGKNALIQKLTDLGAERTTTAIQVQAPSAETTQAHDTTQATHVEHISTSTSTAEDARAPSGLLLTEDDSSSNIGHEEASAIPVLSSWETRSLNVQPSSTPQQSIMKEYLASSTVSSADAVKIIPNHGTTKPKKSAMKRKSPGSAISVETNVTSKKKRVSLAPALREALPETNPLALSTPITAPVHREPMQSPKAPARLARPASESILYICHTSSPTVMPLSSQKQANAASRVLSSIQGTANVPTKRPFRPLLLGLKIQKSLLAPYVTQPKPMSQSRSNPASLPLHYLTFKMPSSITSSSTIAYPPKLFQRKYVGSWAVILSGIFNDDRRNCALVSKMFRYSVYLSAMDILSREFSGRRWAEFSQRYTKSMTNFWPYLRQRQSERQAALDAYNSSFLSHLYHDQNPICQQLWTSPNDEKQIVIALRFLLTRTWFVLSQTGATTQTSEWFRAIVIDTREVVKDELWNVTVIFKNQDPCLSSSIRKQTYYVLESTCEVIGHPSAPFDPSIAVQHDQTPSCISNLPVRVDWSDYVEHRLRPQTAHDSQPLTLIDHLKWTNMEEYDKGIGKLWLRRIKDEGTVGELKRVIANRYILACVAGNSVSGKWMSSTAMAQDFAGIPDRCPSNSKKQKQRVNLFLPEHHLVESVHLTARSGEPLHSALAIVQTPGREYYVFRDNGMEVGCEEDGVWEIWREILRCNETGVVLA